MRAFEKILVLGFLATVVCACATTWRGENISKYEGRLSYSEAVRKWGKPVSKKRLKNGNLVAKWESTYSYILPDHGPTYRPSGSYYYIPYLNNTGMRRYVGREELRLTFDREGILMGGNGW